MRYLTYLAIFVFASIAVGQTGSNRPCSQNLKKATIRGFALGTTKASIDLQLKPVWETQRNGVEKAKVTAFDDKERFGGVKSIEFVVFENRLYTITVIYDSSVRLDNVATFANEISKSWKITEKWTGQGFVQLIECKERTALVTSLRDLTISDNLVQKKIEKNERASERPFKP